METTVRRLLPVGRSPVGDIDLEVNLRAFPGVGDRLTRLLGFTASYVRESAANTDIFTVRYGPITLDGETVVQDDGLIYVVRLDTTASVLTWPAEAPVIPGQAGLLRVSGSFTEASGGNEGAIRLFAEVELTIPC